MCHQSVTRYQNKLHRLDKKGLTINIQLIKQKRSHLRRRSASYSIYVRLHGSMSNMQPVSQRRVLYGILYLWQLLLEKSVSSGNRPLLWNSGIPFRKHVPGSHARLQIRSRFLIIFTYQGWSSLLNVSHSINFQSLLRTILCMV